MACDPENSNKRCPATKELIFHYEGKNAILEKCKDACFKDERCIALSGKFSGNEKWCIGCRIELTDCSHGAIAFKKKELDVGNNKSVNLQLIYIGIKFIDPNNFLSIIVKCRQ